MVGMKPEGSVILASCFIVLQEEEEAVPEFVAEEELEESDLSDIEVSCCRLGFARSLSSRATSRSFNTCKGYFQAHLECRTS